MLEPIFNFSKYDNNSTIKNVTQNAINFDVILSEIKVFQYGMYVQTAKKFFADQLQVSAGIRLDASDYNANTNNPLDQFSPRFSLSYKLNPEFSLNFNTGIYYQLPAYTA